MAERKEDTPFKAVNSDDNQLSNGGLIYNFLLKKVFEVIVIVFYPILRISNAVN